MTDPILTAEHVQMTFADSEEGFEALAEADFTVYPQEVVSIIGPSGCGKSTLLRILAGLIEPTNGKVVFEGKQLKTPQRKIGFVFQQPNLMPWRSALRNVALPLEVEGIPRKQAEAEAHRLLEVVGLSAFADALPRELSGGMSQRVAVARALAHDPDLLLLDEPFAALDALTRERMDWELLKLVQRQHKTVVMVTHNIQEAILLSDRVFTMSPRPGRFEREVIIDLPRPRSAEDQYTPRYVALARELRQSLR
ncbi:MAG: ABC transporter ATP-binding protein [Chloroflexi bacterium]|nr:ABC transporter ATP-binding protein [Chloroflexota bacterium]